MNVAVAVIRVIRINIRHVDVVVVDVVVAIVDVVDYSEVVVAICVVFDKVIEWRIRTIRIVHAVLISSSAIYVYIQLVAVNQHVISMLLRLGL